MFRGVANQPSQSPSGAELGVLVIALDWILGALSPFGMRYRPDLIPIGHELMITQAYRELAAGRSVILGSPAEDAAQRARWETLAAEIRFRPVVCVGYRPTVASTTRDHAQPRYPGWHDPGDWADVQARQSAFAPWAGAQIVDTCQPLKARITETTETIGRRWHPVWGAQLRHPCSPGARLHRHH